MKKTTAGKLKVELQRTRGGLRVKSGIRGGSQSDAQK
jgi:hypothetical protein